jgi:hypothetical protein
LQGLSLEVAAAGVVAHALAKEKALEGVDPWSRRDGWRMHGGATRRFDLEYVGGHHAVGLERAHDGELALTVGGARLPLQILASAGERHDLVLAQRRRVLTVYASGERVSVFAYEGSASVMEVDVLAHAGETAGDAGGLTAPMPGRIVAFLGGGCPYAKGATGNVAMEDVVFMLNGLGIDAGVNLAALVDTGAFISGVLGRAPASRAGKALIAKRGSQ